MFRVVIRFKDESRIISRFYKKTDAEVFKRICEEQIKPPFLHEIYVINALRCIPRPADFPINRREKTNRLWCTICGSFQVFKPWTKGIRRCPRCGISDQDFNIRKENGLFLDDIESFILTSNFRFKEKRKGEEKK
jgi:hypothetical protein